MKTPSRFERLSEYEKSCYTKLGEDMNSFVRRIGGNGFCSFHIVIFSDRIKKHEAFSVLFPRGWYRSNLHIDIKQSPLSLERISRLTRLVIDDKFSSFRLEEVNLHPDFVGTEDAVELKVTHHY
jgi:hypothetical protein